MKKELLLRQKFLFYIKTWLKGTLLPNRPGKEAVE